MVNICVRFVPCLLVGMNFEVIPIVKCFITNNTCKIINSGCMYYRVKFCEKTFNQSSNLKTHSRIHTGVKPYKCKFCEKAFSQSCNLKTHSRIHTGVKPYKCKFCEKTFSHNCSLKTITCICMYFRCSH
jgi:hypothetical protein